jgi:hypothetical protein
MVRVYLVARLALINEVERITFNDSSYSVLMLELSIALQYYSLHTKNSMVQRFNTH